jgi:hypothetical protein
MKKAWVQKDELGPRLSIQEECHWLAVVVVELEWLEMRWVEWEQVQWVWEVWYRYVSDTHTHTHILSLS